MHTYATAGTWTSPLIDGGDPSADKAWRAIGATFAAPELRGNSASVDSVSFPLEYSIDGGATWATAASVDSTDGDRPALYARGDVPHATGEPAAADPAAVELGRRLGAGAGRVLGRVRGRRGVRARRAGPGRV